MMVGGLYLAQVNPYGIHVESMESMLAEASTNLLFHGMVNSIWIPHGFHRFHMEFGHIHLEFHGQVHMDSMEQFHMDSMEIPWNKALFLWETPLSKIMLPSRIEHLPPQAYHMGTPKAILQLHHTTI
jgi:hypothetical protein